MATRKANAVWEGGLEQGKGTVSLGSGAFEGNYSFKSRFEDGQGTNPEELIGAAHAGCYSMALSVALEQAGHAPERVSTKAHVHLTKEGDGFTINKIDLITEAKIQNRRRFRVSVKKIFSSRQSKPKKTARCRKHWRELISH